MVPTSTAKTVTTPMIASRSLLLSVVALAAAPRILSAQSIVRGVIVQRGQGVASAVVQLVPTDPEALPPVTDTALIDQEHLTFLPELLVVRTGTTVQFRNSDPIMHNVFSPRRMGDGFDLGTYPEHESRPHTFETPGQFVILCHVHPEMAAWVLVVPTPFFATTDRDGNFQISEVPPGMYRVQVWHLRLGTAERRAEVLSNRDARIAIDLSPGGSP